VSDAAKRSRDGEMPQRDGRVVTTAVADRRGRMRDAQITRRLFEQVGVREYWLVDPELDTVQVFRPTVGGRLARVEELTAEDGGTLTTPLLPGCGIDIRMLFRPSL
jgi:Uma2 family endonuclease